MSRTATRLASSALLALLIPALVLAQESQTVNSWTEYAKVHGQGAVNTLFRGKPVAPNLNAGKTLAFTTYATRTLFEAAYPGAPLEDFESAALTPGITVECLDLVNSTTTGSCYVAGDLLPGVSYYNSGDPGDFMVGIGAGVFTNPTAIFGPNYYYSDMIMDFIPPREAVAFSVAEGANDVPFDVVAIDGLGTTDTTNFNPGIGVPVFYGVSSTNFIAQIRITDSTPTDGSPPAELIDSLVMAGLVLPVELTSFRATAEAARVQLTWETASETDNAGFEVQHRSGESQHAWVALAYVDGNGTTTEAHKYSFISDPLSPGRHVFRLKQIDFDGAFEYCAGVEALIEVPGQFVLEPAYPNPFNPSTTIRFAVSVEQPVRVVLSDVLGNSIRTLFEGVPEANATQSVRVDGTGLASGMYVVRLEGVGWVASEAIVLMK